MKLHLNLALRRAVLAAMAMVAIHVAQAETTTYNGADAYIYGSGTIESNEWNAIWNKNKVGSLTIGTYQGAASVSLAKKATYNNGKVIFIGGAGNNSGEANASSGVLNIGAATLNVETAVYVGNSQHAITGNLLTIDGGSLTAGTQLYVGAWAGSGALEATDATIKVNSGKDGAVFAMGWRESAQDGEDTVTLDKSTITVGAAGGAKDITTIGRGGSDDTLTLKNGSTANFYDQTIVGEMAGSEGEIYVLSGSSLNLDGTTVLGHAAGAEGAIYVENGTVAADNLVVGEAGSAGISVIDGSLNAQYITLADKAGSAGIMELGDGSVTAELLTIGDAGSASVVGSGELSVTDMVIGNAETGKGSLYTSGTITVADELFVGYKGTGNVFVEGGSLTAKNAYVTGWDSALEAVAGSVSLDKATVLGGVLAIESDATANVSSELILAEGGSLITAGATSVNSALVTSGSVIQVLGGTLTAETIVNDGTMNVAGTLAAGSVSGAEGTTSLSSTGKWDITSTVVQDTINNNGTITLQQAGRIEAAELSGTGETTIMLDKATASTLDGQAIITLEDSLGADVKVNIDTENALALVGKNVDFISVNGALVGLSDEAITGIDGDQWTKNSIALSDDKRLEFTYGVDDNGGYTGVNFTKVAEVIATEGELVFEKTTQQTETNVLSGIKEEDKEVVEAVIDTSSTLQTVTIKTPETTPTPDAEDKSIGLVVSAGVESSALVVETVLVTQKVTNTTTGEVTSTPVGTTGMVLVLDGESTHKGESDNKEKANLGFADELKGKEITTTTAVGETETKQLQTVDHIRVGEGAVVTLENLTMHSTHTLEVQEGAEITFTGVDVKIGGSTDTDIETSEMTVNVYNEDGTPKLDKDGKQETKTIAVENKNAAHLDTGSTIKNATVTIAGGSTVVFATIKSADEKVELGTTTISEGAKVILKSEGKEVTTLGSTDASAQTLVFENTTQLKGTGHVKKVEMKKGSTLTVGSSPGVLKASDLTVNGATEFYFITTSNDWKSGNITATEGTGAISQLHVDKNVTLNGDVRFIYQEWDAAKGEFVECADTTAARKEIGSYITEDTVIQFVTGDIDSLTLGSSFDVLEETLPILGDDMEWDYAQMFQNGTITVISEELEEPTRIANTLVSAGETVLNFGRLAGSQAMLREAGTTRTWASAIANFSSVDGGKKTNGYDSDTWGAAVGVDHAFARNTVVGVAIARTYGENTPEIGTDYYSAGSIDQDATMVGLYGTHKFRTKGLMNDVKLNAFAAYGWFTNDSSRDSIKKAYNATSEWDSNAWVLSASLSRDIATDDGLVVSPYVGVEYTKATMDDATEKGRTYSAEYSADQDYSKLSVKVGVNVSKSFGSFTPYAGIAYINDVSRKAAEVTATGKRATITGKSALPGRDALQLKVGANWQLTESMDLNAGYTAELRDKATEQSANVGIGITF